MNREPVLIVGKDTLEHAQKMLVSQRTEIAIAVAFWGESADKKLDLVNWKAKKITIICNATSGACNPIILSKLKNRFGENFKTNPRLHAKFYWTPTQVIITSANASASGLWHENEHATGNVEAGISCQHPNLIEGTKALFDEINASRGTVIVTDKIIEEAWDLWMRRPNKPKPTRPPRVHSGRKILNVMDKYIDTRVPNKGLYSGVWTAPDLDCDEIRVFGGGSGVSTLGGPIMRDERIGNHRRRIYFKDVRSAHDKPRPDHFKENGCVSHIE